MQPNQTETQTVQQTEGGGTVASSDLDGWANVISVAKEAAKAYAAMLKASDALAGAMGYKEEYVLRRVLPQNADERREVKRILEWVNSEQGGVEKWLAEREELRRKQRERDALMAKLKLTPEEKALLGIDDEAV
jgi:hypothetical protein